MSRAADLRARAAAIQARDHPAPVEAPAPAAPADVRTDPVRQTFDVPPEEHLRLAHWRLDAALQLGRKSVSAQALYEAMATVLLEDETVARRVRLHLERA